MIIACNFGKIDCVVEDKIFCSILICICRNNNKIFETIFFLLMIFLTCVWLACIALKYDCLHVPNGSNFFFLVSNYICNMVYCICYFLFYFHFHIFYYLIRRPYLVDTLLNVYAMVDLQRDMQGMGCYHLIKI